MRLVARLFILALLATAGCRRPVEAPSNPELESLRAVLSRFPPSFSSADERRRVEDRLRVLIDDLLERVERGGADAATHWALGESYRLARNLDWPDTWSQAEHHLRAAAAMSPERPAARVSLGDLYMQGGPEFALKAEREYREALNLARESLPAAQRGLFLACYYQGRFEEAVVAADRYLAAVPADDEVKSLRQMAATNAENE